MERYRLLVEWRNALGCQIACQQAFDERDASEVLRQMIGWSEVSIGDTFHILERE